MLVLVVLDRFGLIWIGLALWNEEAWGSEKK